MKLKKTIYAISLVTLAMSMTSCEKEDSTTTENPNNILGMLVLNEGTYGASNSTISYVDLENIALHKNIYQLMNPNIDCKADAGNCIAINDGKIYVLTSGYIEIADAVTYKQIKRIGITNCRDIKFINDKAYISTYDGDFQEDTQSNIGKVIELNTTTLEVTREINVGYQPEEMEIYNNKLYVANSGGYLYPNYDKTVSVINLSTFNIEKTINVEVNLHRMEIDSKGKIYVSSRGNYADIKSNLYVIDTKNDIVTDTLDIPVSAMYMSKDKLYITSAQWNNDTQGYDISYTLYDSKQEKIQPEGFIKDNTANEIKQPYGISVNPENNDIYILDAKDMLPSGGGIIYCLDSNGKKKWQLDGEIIPGHIAYTQNKINGL